MKPQVFNALDNKSVFPNITFTTQSFILNGSIGMKAMIADKLLVTGNDRQWPLIASMVERMTQRPQVVEWVSGACLLVRRSDVEAAGLLDERFFMYTEDVDLCASVRALGRTVLFEPAAVVVHLRGRSRATVSVAADAAYRRRHVAFYEKHHPRWAPVLRLYLRLKGELPG